MSNKCWTLFGSLKPSPGKNFMFFTKADPAKVKKIVVITLSNIGDIIASFLVLDILRKKFPDAALSVVVGPKGESILAGNPELEEVFVFDKKQPAGKMIEFVGRLREYHFDLALDLRNTAIPFLIGAKYAAPPFLRNDPLVHMKFRHLNRLRSVVDFEDIEYPKVALYISEPDKKYVEVIIQTQIGREQKFVVICPSAADHRKRYSEEGFAELADRLAQSYGVKIVFLGDKGEGSEVVGRIIAKMKQPAVNLSGQTNLKQLSELLRQSSLAIVNDSGPMHIASYLDVPVLTLFGPTDPVVSAPWGKTGYFIKKGGHCPACGSGREDLEHHCMKSITSDEIFNAIVFKDGRFTFGQS